MRENTLHPASAILGEVVVLERVGRLHILMLEHIVGSHEREGRLLVEVLPLAARLLMGFRQQLHRLPAAVAALLTTRNATLRHFQRSLSLAIPTQIENARAT
jgi:hypothetical protein